MLQILPFGKIEMKPISYLCFIFAAQINTYITFQDLAKLNIRFNCERHLVAWQCTVLFGLSQKRPLWSKAWCCVCSKFCSKLDDLGGGGKSSRWFALKLPSTIYPKSASTIWGGVNHTWRFGSNHCCWWFDGKSSVRFTPPPKNRTCRFGVNRTWQFGVNRTWRFEGKSSGWFTPPPPEIVLGDLMC